MRELIFSLNEIFDTGTPAGCLSQYDASCYHIPAYQRGYKWSSEVNGAVPVLLKDLEAAFQSAESEYYLQYITVKRKPLENSGQYCLEVIDGQQRLTTLSVLLSVLSALDKQDNIAREKLHYAVRSHFFSEHIYPAEQVLELAKATWDEWIAAYPQQDRQDIYHLH